VPKPIYEYRRPDGSTFEITQSFADDPLTHDPDTGVSVQRVLHAPAVHFKGKGFYNTDYGTRKRQRENAASSAESSSSEKSSGDGDAGSSKDKGAADGSKGADSNGKAKSEKSASGGSSAGAKSKAESAKS
jgi:predicted nucleic acid-binding Zn ribbon protein